VPILQLKTFMQKENNNMRPIEFKGRQLKDAKHAHCLLVLDEKQHVQNHFLTT
jgi:hypothetical protein